MVPAYGVGCSGPCGGVEIVDRLAASHTGVRSVRNFRSVGQSLGEGEELFEQIRRPENSRRRVSVGEGMGMRRCWSSVRAAPRRSPPAQSGLLVHCCRPALGVTQKANDGLARSQERFADFVAAEVAQEVDGLAAPDAKQDVGSAEILRLSLCRINHLREIRTNETCEKRQRFLEK
jgi:hypothetical protein